jgi:hypothetical protein
MGNYDLQIELLERLIHNWYDIKTPDDFYKVFPEHDRDYLHRDGLCSVCRFVFINKQQRWKMFQEWSLYDYDLLYPVGGVNEFISMKLITDNPKRLHLAVWCLQWLRERNIEEI